MLESVIESISVIVGYILQWIQSPPTPQTFTIAYSRHIQSSVQSVEYLKMYFRFKYDSVHSFLDVCNDILTVLAQYTFGYIPQWISSRKMIFYFGLDTLICLL